MKLFLQKNAKFSNAAKCKITGLRPHTLVPPAAGGLAPRPPLTPIGLAPRPPKQPPPPLRISGYAPVHSMLKLRYTEIEDAWQFNNFA